MRISAPRVRQDHDTLLPGTAGVAAALLAATLIASPWQSALAQAPCTAIESDAERLACYDRALRGTAPAPAPSQTAAPPAAAPAPAASAPTAGDGRRERRVRESTATTAPAAPAARPAPLAPAAPRDEPQTFQIVVVGARGLPGRETTFTLEDGTSWIQTDSQRIVGMPDAPFDAELKPGAMGSYFLVPKERGRAIRVRQIR